MGSEDDFLTRPETAEYLREPVSTLAAWAYLGRGPAYYKVGRRTLYRRSEVDAWIEEQRVAPGKRGGHRATG